VISNDAAPLGPESAGGSAVPHGGPFASGMAPPPEPIAPVVREGRKVGRNEPCPCGSGKKFKHCHGQLAREA
jgi:preprotein translocase subunit SecA